MMAKNNSDQMRKSLVVNEFMENVIFSAFESSKVPKMRFRMNFSTSVFPTAGLLADS